MVDAAPKRLPESTPPCELYPVCQRALAGARAIYLLHPRPLLLRPLRARNPQHSNDFRLLRFACYRLHRKSNLLGMRAKLGEAAPSRSATQLIGNALRAFSAGAAARGLAQRERGLRARGRVRVLLFINKSSLLLLAFAMMLDPCKTPR